MDVSIPASSRRWLTDQLEQIAQTYGSLLPKSPAEAESLVCRRARNRAEYEWLGKNLILKALQMARAASQEGSQPRAANKSSAEVCEPQSLLDERTSKSPSCPLSDQSASSSTDGSRALSPNLKQVRYSVGGPLAIDQRTFVTPVRILQEADSQVAPPTPKSLAKHTVSILTRSTVLIACRQDASTPYGLRDGSRNNGGNKGGPKVIVKGVRKDGYKDGLKVIYTDASKNGLNAALVDRSDGTTQRPKDRVSSRQRATERYGPKDKMQAASADGMTDGPRCGEPEASSLGGSAKMVGEDEVKTEGGMDRSQFYEASFTFLVPSNRKIEEMTIYLQPGDP